MLGLEATIIYLSVMVFILVVMAFYLLFCPENKEKREEEIPSIKDTKQSRERGLIRIDPETVDFENRTCRGIDNGSLYHYDELCGYLKAKFPHIRFHYNSKGEIKKVLHLVSSARTRIG